MVKSTGVRLRASPTACGAALLLALESQRRRPAPTRAAALIFCVAFFIPKRLAFGALRSVATGKLGASAVPARARATDLPFDLPCFSGAAASAACTKSWSARLRRQSVLDLSSAVHRGGEPKPVCSQARLRASSAWGCSPENFTPAKVTSMPRLFAMLSSLWAPRSAAPSVAISRRKAVVEAARKAAASLGFHAILVVIFQ